MRVVGERLELERVAAGIAEEHRRLLAELALEADMRRDPERHARRRARRSASASQSAIVSTTPKCGTGTSWPSTEFSTADRLRGGIEMRDDLMAEQVEIDPVIATSAPRDSRAPRRRRRARRRDRGPGRRGGRGGSGTVSGTAAISARRCLRARGDPGGQVRYRAAMACSRDPLPAPRSSAGLPFRDRLRAARLVAAAACSASPVLLSLVHDAPTLRRRCCAAGCSGSAISRSATTGSSTPSTIRTRCRLARLCRGGAASRSISRSTRAGDGARLAVRRSPRSAPAAGADLGFVLAAAAAWIVTEWLRGVMFTGYPWNPLGVVWVPRRASAVWPLGSAPMRCRA